MECEGYRKGRCKVVMWCDRTRPVGCTTSCTAVLQLYESTVDSPPAHPAAVPLYSGTRAPSAEPQPCTAVRGQKQSSLASWSFIASAVLRTVHIQDVGANPEVGVAVRRAVHIRDVGANPNVVVAVSPVSRAPTDVASPRRHLQAHTSVMYWSFE